MPAVGTERGDRALSGGEPTTRNGVDLRPKVTHQHKAWEEAIANDWMVLGTKDDRKTISRPPASSNNALSPDCNNCRIVIRRNAEVASAKFRGGGSTAVDPTYGNQYKAAHGV